MTTYFDPLFTNSRNNSRFSTKIGSTTCIVMLITDSNLQPHFAKPVGKAIKRTFPWDLGLSEY